MFLLWPMLAAASREDFGRVYIGLAKSNGFEVRLNEGTSLAEQRQWAWQVLNHSLSGDRPEWLTWYTSVEATQIFIQLYPTLSEQESRGEEPVADAKLEAALQNWFARLTTNRDWSEADYQIFVSHLKTKERRLGVRGVPHIVYNWPALKHHLKYFFAATECYRGDRNFAPDNDTLFAPCLSEAMPREAALFKLKWVRLHPSIPRFNFLSDDNAFEQMAAGEWQWRGQLYTEVDYPLQIEMQGGERYALQGVHVMRKDLPHWAWVSAWWSREAQQVLAEDRPAYLHAWLQEANLCVNAGFEWSSNDINSLSAFPNLQRRLESMWNLNDGGSWCSNPYLEEKRGNARTNCVGCHQSAGLRAIPDQLLRDSLKNPALILKPQRLNFPADYLWSFDRSENAAVPSFSEWRAYFESQWQKILTLLSNYSQLPAWLVPLDNKK